MLFCKKQNLNYGPCLCNCRAMRGRNIETTGWKLGDLCQVSMNKSSTLSRDKSHNDLGFKIGENDENIFFKFTSLTLFCFCFCFACFVLFYFTKSSTNDRLLFLWDVYSVAQSCPIFCDPMDCSLPGSSVHGIFQARLLEWVVISFSRESSQLRDQTFISYVLWIGRQILYHCA